MSIEGEMGIVGILSAINETISAGQPISAEALLTLLKTVDGPGSGLDADMLDGSEGADFVPKILAEDLDIKMGDESSMKILGYDNLALIRFQNYGPAYPLLDKVVRITRLVVDDELKFSSFAFSGNSGFLYVDDAGAPDFLAETSVRENTAWQALTLLNDWVDYGPSHASAGYRVDALGQVHLRGHIKDGVDDNIAVLPVGFRPQKILHFPAVTYNNDVARVLAKASGEIEAIGYDNTWLSLSGISFFTD